MKINQKIDKAIKKEKAIKLYRDGIKPKEIAKLVKRDHSTVLWWLLEEGIGDERKSVLLAKRELYKKMYDEGMCIAEIARKTGYCASGVHKALIRHGVKLRNQAGNYIKYKE